MLCGQPLGAKTGPCSATGVGSGPPASQHHRGSVVASRAASKMAELGAAQVVRSMLLPTKVAAQSDTWETFTDPATGCSYQYNPTTGESRWAGSAAEQARAALRGERPVSASPRAPAPPIELEMVSPTSADVFRQSDFDDGTLELLVIAPQPLWITALAKIVAHWLTTGLPLLVASPVIGIMLNLEPRGYGVLLTAMALGTAIISLVGALGAALSLGSRRSDVLPNSVNHFALLTLGLRQK